jgi:hypothetical protein
MEVFALTATRRTARPFNAYAATAPHSRSKPGDPLTRLLRKLLDKFFLLYLLPASSIPQRDFEKLSFVFSTLTNSVELA